MTSKSYALIRTAHGTARSNNIRIALFVLTAPMVYSLSAQAELIGEVEFPQGSASFADVVIDYSPVGSTEVVDPARRGPHNALGRPNFDTNAPACTGPNGADLRRVLESRSLAFS